MAKKSNATPVSGWSVKQKAPHLNFEWSWHYSRMGAEKRKAELEVRFPDEEFYLLEQVHPDHGHPDDRTATVMD